MEKELIFTDKNKKQVAEINAINVIDLKTNDIFVFNSALQRKQNNTKPTAVPKLQSTEYFPTITKAEAIIITNKKIVLKLGAYFILAKA